MQRDKQRSTLKFSIHSITLLKTCLIKPSTLFDRERYKHQTKNKSSSPKIYNEPLLLNV